MKRNLLYLFFAFCLAFTANAQVSITGEAVGGWGDGHDFDMTSTDNVHWTYSGLICQNAAAGGGIKFRFNHAWDVNWGAADFPIGVGTQGGANILCTAGSWDVSFNSTTGEYSFISAAPIPVVKLVGTASPGGDLTMGTLDGTHYTLGSTDLVDGTAQVSIDGALYGGDTFPTGNVSDPALFIPVTAGTYSSITVDISTGEYVFTAAPVFQLISITGIAVGGWGDGHDFDMTTTDGVHYTFSGLVVNGVAPDNELKFRTNHDWGQPSYGGSGWPTGIATTSGPNIVATTSGTYNVTFNLTTGEYTFAFPSIAIVGSGTPGGWPGTDPDPHVMATTDGTNYTLAGQVILDGEAKFRQDNGWTVNWGAAAFPSGIGTQDGANIPTSAGTYDITFNRATGAFDFAVLATKGFSNATLKVFPNPTQNTWTFNSAQAIETIQIVDVLGKTVATVTPKNNTANVDASSLNAGIYFAKIATAAATQTIKLVKN